VAEKLIVV
jgi:elongator complex protein 6